MLVSPGHRFLFIHVPKAAGQSLRAALEPWAEEPARFRIDRPAAEVEGRPNPLYAMWQGAIYHARARDVRAELPDEFGAYFKFAFVRNPFDALVSMYHFVLGDETHPRRELVRGMASFQEYLTWAAETRRPFPKMPSKLQKDYVVDENGEVIVDFLGRYENLQSDFASVRKKLGIDCELPWVNRTRHEGYRDHYDDACRRIVEQHWAEDLRFLGYSFDGPREDGVFSRSHPSTRSIARS